MVLQVKLNVRWQKKKADKDEHRAKHKKRAAQKANQQAGMESDSEDEFEECDNPLVRLFISIGVDYSFAFVVHLS